MVGTQIPDKPVSVLNFIGGEFVEGKGASFEIESPLNGTTIGTSKETTQDEVDAAVQKAHQTSLEWRLVPIKERCTQLLDFRNKFMARVDEMAHLASAESGKTFSEAKAGLLKGIEVTDFAISLQNQDLGGAIEVSRGVKCQYRREALGVVAGIAPFNFPGMVPMWMYPVAIALGNSFILKPSEKVPLTSQVMAQVINDSILPNGVFTTLNGKQDTVEAIIDHPLTQAIGFVGSTPVAKSVYMRATALGKRSLSLGGAKNHLIVVPDADPELTAQGVLDSFTGCAGQRCMAASLMLAVGEVDSIVDAISKKAGDLKTGQQMGAIIDKGSYDRIHGILERAEKEDVKFLVDGRNVTPPAGCENGYWIGPTILEAPSHELECATAEIFGPVLTIVRVPSVQKAIELENKNPFGNATSVFTTSGAVAQYVETHTSNGMIGINIGVPVPREPFSFGGTKESRFGYGDITGQGGVEFWSNRKKITSKWSIQKDQNWMS